MLRHYTVAFAAVSTTKLSAAVDEKKEAEAAAAAEAEAAAAQVRRCRLTSG